MRTALIDGDVLVYAAGFASDGAAKKRLLEEMGGDKAKLLDYLKHNPPPHEPLNYCLNGLNTMIRNIVKTAEADSSVIYLSHPVNFREGFFPDYKMNRDITHKPFWESEIKDFLLERHEALFSAEGDEADDALGIHQCAATLLGEETIICSIDKDLDMIPGLHYNFSKTKRANGIYRMDDPHAMQLFYSQILSGDTADNIPGMYKHMGQRCEARWLIPLEDMSSESEMYDYVMKVYKGDEEFVHMVAKLLWIKRDPNWWSAPTKKRKVVYG